MQNKKVRIQHGTRGEEREAESVEQVLRDVAEDVRSGRIAVPFELKFEGPGGLEFTIAVKDEEQAQELTRQGFMY